MHISSPARRLLKLVFAATSAAVTRPALERRSGLSRIEVNHAIAELAGLGLLDGVRLRLTLPGLALAVACGARSKAQASPARHARRSTDAVSAPIALFFQREPPRAVA